MKTMTRKWSSMETLLHSKGMESAWPRSRVSSSILVRLTGMMCDTCSRAGLSRSLDRVRISSVKMHRRMFL